MSIDIMLSGLLIVSTLTGLVTEAIKNIFATYEKSYHANVIAGIVSIVLTIIVSVAYVVIGSVTITAQLIVYFVAFMILSWLCSMIGYDKVVQTITQLTGSN